MVRYSMRSAEEFDAWLSEHSYFDDAMVRTFEPAPAEPGAATPERVTIEFAYQVSGGLRAGDLRRLRRIRLHCDGVTRFELHPPGSVSANHWSEGVELLESEGRIRFAIDVPGRLLLECGSAEAEELPDQEEVITPWESDREVFLTIRGAAPSPETISARCLERTEVALVWRIYGGEARPQSSVPKDHYDGWFLQMPDRVAHTEGGVTLRVTPGPHSTRLVLTNWDQENKRLWAAVLATVSTLDVLEAHCGNRELDADAFRELAKRKLATS
ncbi:MAG: hypothetical protein L0Y66_16025 [Myxococcaceae bacterium]|nr:hypothetical protein [Myxococcaceae bacterium]MCI0669917.1 hypothetical protein [Myxococcaceae bacterium]